jgi:hypothetical protein
MADTLVADTVLLLRESEGDERSGKKISLRTQEVVQGAGTEPELDVAKAEHVSILECGRA